MGQHSGALTLDDSAEPLNPRQRAFARELGVAMARGDRDYTAAYAAVGYTADRGNAARLAADPRVKAIAEEICAEQLRLAGLHIAYLQAKALELLHASPTKMHRILSKAMTADIYETEHGPIAHPRLRDDLTPEEEAEIDAATWALSEFKIDKDGVITVKVPDKKGLIEMLAKQLGVGKEDSSVNVDVSLEALVQQSIQREAAE